MMAGTLLGKNMVLLYRVFSRLILFVFLSLMVYVVFVAYTHKSGITGIDVAEMHLLKVKKA